MNKKQMLRATLLACSCSSLVGSSLFLGDLTTADSNQNGFSFNILKKLGKNRSQEIVFTGSSADLHDSEADIKNFALSVASAAGTKCKGIAPENATINGVQNQPNPIHGAQLSNIEMASSCPVVMKENDPETLYVLTSSPFSSISTLLTNNGVFDANGEQGSFISYIESVNQNTIQGVDPIIFVATKPAGGNFGDSHGGIALFRKTATGLVQQKAVVNNDTIVSIPIEKNTPTFVINNQLSSLEENRVNLYWSDKLFRLFVGVQALNGSHIQDGSRSVGVGYVQDNGENATLTLYPIAPNATITGETKIIGARGQNLASYVHKQTVMFTSTGLSYLIIVGDSFDAQNNNNAQRMCFALPLVDESVNPSKAKTWRTSTTHATLAAKNSLPESFYTRNIHNLSVITGRGFQTPATLSAHLYDRTDNEVLVGKYNLTNTIPGKIVDLDVYNDTVFVALDADTNGGQYSGIFYSQAIFDEHGVIANWTRWQRFTFIADTIHDCMYTPGKGGAFQLETRNDEPRSVTLSQWSQGDKDGLLGGTLADQTVGLVNLLNTEFTQEKGGVFGLFDFHNAFAPTFFDQIQQTAMMVATGYQKIGIFLTRSSEDANDFAVTGDYKNQTLYYTNGKIDPAPDHTHQPKGLIISGGALDDIEAITSATIVCDGTNDKRFIIVGGTNGLAVLRNQTSHTGIDDIISAWFDGLRSDGEDSLVFEIIGNFKNIKKLWTSTLEAAQWVFILTHDGLYRISAEELSQETPDITTLITLETPTSLNLSVHDFFTDVVASHTFCLLGTNKGLLRNGNDTVIFQATNDTDCNWTSVDLLTPYKHVAQLVPLLTSNTPYEFAAQGDGQVYALTHSKEYTTSALHCFAIKNLGFNGSTITDTTCLPVYKETIEGVYTPFMTFGSLRNSVIINGALIGTSSLTELNKTSQLLSAPVNNFRMTRAIENYPFTEIKLSLSHNAEIIRGFVYNTALGSCIAYGNFGIRVCE